MLILVLLVSCSLILVSLIIFLQLLKNVYMFSVEMMLNFLVGDDSLSVIVSILQILTLSF